MAEKRLVLEDHASHAPMARCGERVVVGFNNRINALVLRISLDPAAVEIQASTRDGAQQVLALMPF